MLGAHLDSVPAGPGINDNGSGAALVLEVARALRHTRLAASFRFAFWGAEERGRLGSTHYVDALGREERARIDAYLNFDMVASPNFAPFVYSGPRMSRPIQRAFRNAFERRGLRVADANLGGASDHAPFARAGIAVGGLFTGARALKSGVDARLFGGTAGKPYDPCYHRACDALANASLSVLAQMTEAAAAAAVELAGSPERAGAERPRSRRAPAAAGGTTTGRPPGRRRHAEAGAERARAAGAARGGGATRR